jgi:UDP-glucose 4-epimerase
LIERGDEVHVLDDLSSGKRANVYKNATLHVADVASPETTGVVAKLAPDLVCHLAAQKSVGLSVADPAADARINIFGLIRVMEGVRSLATKPRVLFSSTGGAIYGDGAAIPTPETADAQPFSPYGVSKLSSEKYLGFYEHEYGIPFTALRFANVYGPRQDPKGEAGVVAIFAGKVVSREPFTINGDGLQTRDYIFVGDVVSALLAARDRGVNGVFNIGTGLETPLVDLVRAMQKAAPQEVEVRHGPARAGEQRRSALDTSRAQKMLGWKAKTPLAEGLAITIKSFLPQ